MEDIRQLGISRARFGREPALDQNRFEVEIYDEIRVIRSAWDERLVIVQVPDRPGNPALTALQTSLSEAKLRSFWLYGDGVTRFWYGRVTRYQPVFVDKTSGWFWITVAGSTLVVPE